MSEHDSLPFDYPSDATPTGARPKPHRHRWVPYPFSGGEDRYVMRAGDNAEVRIVPSEWCDSCHRWRDPVQSRKGRNNKKRGGAIQRKRIEGLGGRNLAGNNPNLDGIGALFAYESKSGGSFSERYWRWLSGIPRNAGQVGVLIVTETPGRGHKARSIVVVDYDDWRDLHGEKP